MLFPTIRFAIFFVVVMPASWMLMPLARDHTARLERDQPWAVPALLLGGAALIGPLAPSGLPTAVRALTWLLALGLAALALVRWFDLRGLARWNLFTLVASYVFYGAYEWRFVGLLIASTVFNQLIAGAIDSHGDARVRRTWLTVGVIANLGLLGWFKYKGFFIESASGLFEGLGLDITPPARALIPPVGISFFTFQALSYVIDVYRRKLRPAPLLDFAVYLSFFPHLVAGPIVRASEFLPQLRVPRDARRVDTGLAFWLITAGLFKKVVVSSYLADAIVDPVFRLPSQHQAADTLLGIYGYAIQIYCDFSGYTDMAIGLALLLGFRFPQNFDAPYTAATLQEFWRRWHMTLSRWLRDYLYIPLGGSQRGPGRAYLNLFLTMLIGGLWHGAAWTFVVWGARHGGYLAGERFLAERRDRLGPAETGAPRAAEPALATPALRSGPRPRPRPRTQPPDEVPGDEPPDGLDLGPAALPQPPQMPQLSPSARRWLGRILTFHVVCLGWVFFRAPTLSDAFAVLGRLTDFGTGKGVNLMVVGTIAALLASQFVPSEAVGRAQARFSRLGPVAQGSVLAIALMVTSALAPAGVAPFIYFAF